MMDSVLSTFVERDIADVQRHIADADDELAPLERRINNDCFAQQGDRSPLEGFIPRDFDQLTLSSGQMMACLKIRHAS